MRIKALKKVSSDEGFTLLELIVVVAVLGILAAIAIQQFQVHRARAIADRRLIISRLPFI